MYVSVAVTIPHFNTDLSMAMLQGLVYAVSVHRCTGLMDNNHRKSTYEWWVMHFLTPLLSRGFSPQNHNKAATGPLVINMTLQYSVRGMGVLFYCIRILTETTE